MKNINKLFYTILFVLVVFTQGFSQCRDLNNILCMKKLDPFIFNGQHNRMVLTDSTRAELNLTFYGGQKYRVYICSEDKIGKIEFTLYDANQKEIFSNRNFNYVSYWDFVSKTTQKITLDVNVAKDQKEKPKAKSGCVSILIGFKQP